MDFSSRCVVRFGRDAGPSIPYEAEVRSNGSFNHGFIDLRDASACEVEEARHHPAFSALILHINNGSRHLMTLGCEVGFFDVLPSFARLSPHIGSYIDLAFRDPSQNSIDKMCAMAEHVRTYQRPPPKAPVYIEMTIEEMPSFFGHIGCFSMSIKICCYAPNEQGAAAIFQAECDRLRVSIDAAAEHALNTDTISQRE